MGATVDQAERRLTHVNDILRDSPEHSSVTIGLAEVTPDDSLDDIVARADAALYRKRRR